MNFGGCRRGNIVLVEQMLVLQRIISFGADVETLHKCTKVVGGGCRTVVFITLNTLYQAPNVCCAEKVFLNGKFY